MRFVGLLVAGFCLGIYFFFRGFRFLHRYHTFADTPQTPIRAAAMGFVEVSGTAHGDEIIASPVSHTACYFYKVKLDRWHQGNRGGRWAAFAVDADGVRFYLEDETGRVLVDAQDAEIDLQDPCQTEVTLDLFSPGAANPSTAPSYMPPSEDELVEYIRRAGSGSRTAAFQAGDPSLRYRVNPPLQKARRGPGGAPESLPGPGLGHATPSGRYRLTEYCLVPDMRYTVTGTCVENPRPHGDDDRNLILKGESESTFLISDASKADLESIAGWRTAKYIFGGAALTVASAALLLQSMGWLQSDFLARLLK